MLLIVFLYSIVALSLLLTATTNALSSTATPKIINTNDIYTIPNLQSKVAIVTGASRGIGRGIAIELGRAGMTVYVVGRSSTTTGYISNERELGSSTLEDRNRYTVEGTANEIHSLNKGGKAIPVAMDITNDADLVKLVSQVRNECNRLDLVVCSAFTTPSNLATTGGASSFRDEFWNQGSSMWDACHTVGLRGSYVTCCECVPLMIDTAANDNKNNAQHSSSSTAETTTTKTTVTTRPLIVLISSFGGKSYTFNVAYGVGKAGADRHVHPISKIQY